MRSIVLPAGPGKTAVLEVDETDHIGRILARGHWYEQDLLTDAARRVTGPGTAVDVGAHIGSHALWFAVACGLDVVAIEPRPDTFDALRRNIAANPTARIRALAAAAGAEPGHGTVIAPEPGNSGTARIATGAGPVPVVTLDALDLQDVRLLKVDVEGAAVDVLAGAKQLLAEQSPIVYAEGDRDAIAAVLPEGYVCFGEFAKTPTWGFAR